MDKNIQEKDKSRTYYVNDVAFETDDKKLRAKEILEIAGYKPYTDYILIRMNGHKVLDDYEEEMPIHDDERFEAVWKSQEPALITYYVNGELFKTPEKELTVKTILEDAGFKPCTDYNLLRVAGNQTYSDYDVKIAINDGESFTAVFKGQTQVSGW